MKQEKYIPPTWMPEHGAAYLCLRGNKESGTKRGNVYIYDTHHWGQGELVHCSSRWQTRLAGGYNALRQPGAFERLEYCPFCRAQMRAGEKLVHDAVQCARDHPCTGAKIFFSPA